MTAELAAVIVNYNAGPELASAMQSIADNMAGRCWEAVVVDNASIDGSSDLATTFTPSARVVRNAVNVGFGRGVNQGVAASTAPFILIMNPDCRLEHGALATMRAELGRRQRCAIVGPRVLDPDGSEQGSARGDPDMLTGLFGRTGVLRNLLPSSSMSRRNVVSNGESATVDWVSGACMLVRRTAFDEVGGFDARYFLYWEDADLCRRLRARGYEIRYVPAATAVHRVGHSSKTARAASIKAFHESAYLYYSTHVAPGALNPKRGLARLLLAARCWWRLRSV
jgi:N-acetylglucosaminyl-diphospho-decaprenol L-rhamnosyltransferase